MCFSFLSQEKGKQINNLTPTHLFGTIPRSCLCLLVFFCPPLYPVLLFLGLFQNAKENLKNTKDFPHLAYPPKTLENKQKTLKKTKENPSKKDSKETKTSRKRTWWAFRPSKNILSPPPHSPIRRRHPPGRSLFLLETPPPPGIFNKRSNPPRPWRLRLPLPAPPAEKKRTNFRNVLSVAPSPLVVFFLQFRVFWGTSFAGPLFSRFLSALGKWALGSQG